MDTKVLEALRASISHWQDNANVIELHGASVSSKDCALCKLFLDNYCRGCPVAEVSGHLFCGNTPYNRAFKTHDVWCATTKYTDEFDAARTEFREAAKAELKFLESLLPKED